MPVLLPAALIAVIAVVSLAVTSRRADADATPAEQRARLHLRRSRRVALLAGGLTAVVTILSIGSFGQGWLVAPSLGAALAALVVLVGERTAPTEAGARRTASLETRSPSRVVRPVTWLLLGAGFAALAGLVTWSSVVASSDDQGRAGRAVEWMTADGSQSHTPWPGSFYAWPLSASLVVMLACIGGALVAAARRVQANADARSALDDAALRRESVAFVMRAALLALAVTLAGVSLVIGCATAVLAAGSPMWASAMHWVARGALLVALATALGAIRPVAVKNVGEDGAMEESGR